MSVACGFFLCLSSLSHTVSLRSGSKKSRVEVPIFPSSGSNLSADDGYWNLYSNLSRETDRGIKNATGGLCCVSGRYRRTIGRFTNSEGKVAPMKTRGSSNCGAAQEPVVEVAQAR